MKFYQATNILGAIISQIIVLILIFFLSPEQYGYYSLMIVVSQILFISVLGWNDALILNFGTKEHIENGHIKNVFNIRIIFVIISLVFALSLYWLFYDYIISFVKNEKFVSLVLIYFFSELFFNLGSNIFYAKDKNNLQSIINLAPRVAQLCFIAFYFVDIESFIYFSLLSNFIAFFISISIYMKYEFKIKVTLNKSDFSFYLKFGLLQFFSIASVYIINWGDNFALSFYNVNISDIGNYNFAYKIFLGFNVIFALINILVPKIIYKYKKDGDSNQISQLMNNRKNFVIVLSLLYIFAIIALWYLLSYFGKNEYLKSLEYASLLFAAFIFMLYVDFIVPLIINTPFFKKVQFTVLNQAVINLVLNFIFTYFYGIYGVIIGTTMAYLYKLVSLQLLYKKDVKIYLEGYKK